MSLRTGSGNLAFVIANEVWQSIKRLLRRFTPRNDGVWRLLRRVTPRNDERNTVIANKVKQSVKRLLRRFTPRNDGVYADCHGLKPSQ